MDKDCSGISYDCGFSKCRYYTCCSSHICDVSISALKAYKARLVRKTGIKTVFYPNGAGWVLETDNYIRDKDLLDAIFEIDKMID